MRHHMAQRVGTPGNDAQRAGRFLMHLPRLDHGGLEPLEQRRDAGCEAPPGLGGRDMARRAVEEPQREVVLQFTQRARSRCCREAERTARRRDAAAIEGAQEKPEGGQPVHAASLVRLNPGSGPGAPNGADSAGR